MSQAKNFISVVIATCGGFIAYWLGGFDKLLMTLVGLTVIDYLTGVLDGFYSKSLSSEIGLKGVIKKISMYLVVAVAYLLEENIGIPALREVVILFFISNEGLSIIENISLLGIKLPKKLEKALEILQKEEVKQEIKEEVKQELKNEIDEEE